MAIIKASDYPKFRPIPRLHRNVIISEKIDGTNGLIGVTRLPDAVPLMDPQYLEGTTGVGVTLFNEAENRYERFIVRAGSRNRWLTPDNDNFGFARWVWDNAVGLAALGEGNHYGEWFGKGIQSGYGLGEKRFALFNTARWFDLRNPGNNEEHLRTFPKATQAPAATTVVPILDVTDGQYLNLAVTDALHTLKRRGSVIAPGFTDPEGVVAYHVAAKTYFKATIKNDDVPKGKVTK